MRPVRILIADDHELVRRGIRSLFAAHMGWEICGEAVDGRDAVAKAKQLLPDVIVLDITMPNLNGLQAARVLHRHLPNCRILIVSQHDPAQMRPQALAAGARAYVAKSDLSAQLISVVENMLLSGQPLDEA